MKEDLSVIEMLLAIKDTNPEIGFSARMIPRYGFKISVFKSDKKERREYLMDIDFEKRIFDTYYEGKEIKDIVDFLKRNGYKKE